MEELTNILNGTGKQFCPFNSDRVCRFNEVCCINGSSCCKDAGVALYLSIVIGIIVLLLLVTIVLAYKTYHKWKRDNDSRELKMTDSKESDPKGKLNSDESKQHLKDICLDKEKSSPSLDASLHESSLSVKH